MKYDLRKNHVIVASAGTGKTHALVGTLCHALLGATDLLAKAGSSDAEVKTGTHDRDDLLAKGAHRDS
jgi:ATP-dependent exoDNAse (exonuclease V) beta subunit